MFEGPRFPSFSIFEALEFVSPFLIRYLGDYVDIQNVKDLKVSLLQGNVRLTGLRLKSTCLDFLGLPIQVEHGTIGNLTLVVPWTNLKNERVIVQLSDLLIIARPHFKEKKSVPSFFTLYRD